MCLHWNFTDRYNIKTQDCRFYFHFVPDTGISLMFMLVVVGEAGEGVVEISISDPTGHLIPNQVTPVEVGVLDVVFKPSTMGMHQGNVTFNRQKVPGQSSQRAQVLDLHVSFILVFFAYILKIFKVNKAEQKL